MYIYLYIDIETCSVFEVSDTSALLRQEYETILLIIFTKAPTVQAWAVCEQLLCPRSPEPGMLQSTTPCNQIGALPSMSDQIRFDTKNGTH